MPIPGTTGTWRASWYRDTVLGLTDLFGLVGTDHSHRHRLKVPGALLYGLVRLQLFSDLNSMCFAQTTPC